MTVLPVLAVGILMNLVAILFILVSVILILLVLIQKGRGGGLSAAFGGGMASGLLGSKTGDFLTWATITVVSVFLVLAVLLAKFYKPGIAEFSGSQRSAQPAQKGTPAQPSGGTPQSVPSGPPVGAGAGATAPQSQPPVAPQPGGGAATPAPEANSTGR
jgi:preprotein translocase subunit SecG